MFNNLRAHQGGYPNPTVAAKFAQSANDFTTLLTTTSMPSGGSVSRSGQAMVYDSTGKLTYAPNNMFLQSQVFTNASWLKIGATVTSVGDLAPDGTATTSRLQLASGASYLYQGVQPTGVITINSFYVKSNTGSNQTFRIFGNGTGSASANLTATTVWQRFSFINTSTSGSSCGLTTDSSTNACDLLIWGAQLEAVTYQTTPSTYVATTTAAYYGPRFDYDPSTLAAKGLLIEGTRTNLLTYSEQLDNAAWAKGNSTVSANATTAPDGTSSADNWISTAATATTYAQQSITVSATNYTLSVYAKNNGARYIQLCWSGGVSTNYANFDLVSGTVTAGTYVSASISSVGNGWFRISMTSLTAAASGVAQAVMCNTGTDARLPSYVGNGTSGFYIFGFQLEAASFASSYIPTVASSVARAAETFSITGYTNRLLEAYYIDQQTNVSSSLPETVVSSGAVTISPPTFGWVTSVRTYTNAYAGSIASPSWLSFSRSGNAMMTDSTGTLTWAPANMLTYSEQLDNAAWSKLNTTVTANAVAAPDGTTTADKLIENTTASVAHYGGQNLTTSATNYTLSVYIQAAGRTRVEIAATTANRGIGFDLGSGTVVAGTYAGAQGTGTIQNVGSGWYRCSMTFTATAATESCRIVLHNGTSVTYTGDGTSGVYLWGAQLEPVTYATAPSAYIPTTTAAIYGPRYDYDASTVPATPRGLLIEESRSNLVTYSEQFDNAAWTKTAATVTANVVYSPDGTQSADKLVEDTTAASVHRTYGVVSSLTSSATYTYSVYVKAAGRTSLYIMESTLGGAYFDLSAVTYAPTSGYTGSAKITAVGNGWFRCSITVALGVSQTTFVGQIRLASGNSDNYTGDGTSGIFLWGAQLEAGSFATSYIPTTSASVTRAADVAQLTGSALTTLQATSFSAGIECLSMSTGSYILLAGPSGAGALLYTNSNTSAGTYDPLSSPTSANVTAGTGGFLTIGRTFVSNNASGRSAVMNNGTVGTAGTLVTARSAVQIGAYSTGTGYNNGWYRSFAAYNQRLPDTVLKTKSAVGAPY